MASQLNFKRASTFSLEELASAFNAGFEGYFHPMTVTAEVLARRLRMEHIDLHQSFVADNEGEFAGFAFFGLRGREAWCGGLGVAPKFRGQGFAMQVMSEFFGRARRCGVTNVRLEVLTKNTPAIRLYERAGMRITRDLLILERTGGVSIAAENSPHLQQVDSNTMLRHFDRLHAWRPAWQREFASILSADGVVGLCLGDRDNPDSYAILVMRSDGVTQLVDMAAANARDAEALSAALTQRYGEMRLVNEPEDSFFISALTANGFIEVERQHEMSCELFELL